MTRNSGPAPYRKGPGFLIYGAFSISQNPEEINFLGVLLFAVLKLLDSDAIQGASEACDQAVVTYGAWSKRAKQR